MKKSQYKLENLKAKSVGELNTELAELEQRLMTMRYNHTISPVENPAEMTAIRKDIARIKTFQTAQKAANNK